MTLQTYSKRTCPKSKNKGPNFQRLFAACCESNPSLNVRVNSFVENTIPFLTVNDIKVTYGIQGSVCCVTSLTNPYWTNARDFKNYDWRFFPSGTDFLTAVQQFVETCFLSQKPASSRSLSLLLLSEMSVKCLVGVSTNLLYLQPFNFQTPAGNILYVNS